MALNMFRKLVSKKQIQDAVNKGIEDGDVKSLNVFQIGGTVKIGGETCNFDGYIIAKENITLEEINSGSHFTVIEFHVSYNESEWYAINPQNGWSNDSFICYDIQDASFSTLTTDNWEFTLLEKQI